MTRAELTEKLLDIKREKGWTWKYICSEIGGMSPILVTGAILGQMKLTKPQAANAAINRRAYLGEIQVQPGRGNIGFRGLNRCCGFSWSGWKRAPWMSRKARSRPRLR